MLSRIDIKYFKEIVGQNRIGKESDNDISARCPFCSDAKKSNPPYRLHLYQKGDVTNVNCFNAGCRAENKSVYAFIRDLAPEKLANYKREKFQTSVSSLKSLSTKPNIPKIHKRPEPNYIDLIQYFEPLRQEQIDYLNSRKIPIKNFYNGKYNLKIGDITYNIKDYLIIPLFNGEKIYGFYSRSITDKKFITYNSTIGFKVWNWFNVDITKPVYIFEAIFDALSSGLPNVIANLGASLPDDRLKELKDPVFCLDNDKTGITNSIKYAKEGYKIYIQPNIYKEKDMNELKLNQNIDISEMIKNNIYSGVSAITRLKLKL